MKLKINGFDDGLPDGFFGLIEVDKNGIFIKPSKQKYERWEYDQNWELPDVDRIRQAMVWVSKNVIPVKHFKRDMDSYMLKHVIEENIGSYISNGEAIVIMKNLGFNIRFHFDYYGNLSLNCTFNAAFCRQVTRKHGQIRPSLYKQIKWINKRFKTTSSVLADSRENGL